MRGSSVFRILSAVILILVILICLPLSVPKIFGFEPYAIISGSMEPEIPVGSVVYAKQVTPELVAQGDIIVFYGGVNQNTVVTHRVMENNPADGEFITKGDANDKEDVNPVPYKNLIGEVTLHLPVLGRLQPLVAGGSGKIILVAAIFIALLLNIIGNFIGNNSKQ